MRKLSLRGNNPHELPHQRWEEMGRPGVGVQSSVRVDVRPLGDFTQPT